MSFGSQACAHSELVLPFTRTVHASGALVRHSWHLRSSGLQLPMMSPYSAQDYNVFLLRALFSPGPVCIGV